MISLGLLVAASGTFMAGFFLIALWGDLRGRFAERMAASPYTYALSLAVYCTAWTYYGSVGLAATNGLAFLPIYLGPTLAALLFPFLQLKIMHLTRRHGITSIADLIAYRYGKSARLASLITLVMLVAAVPYVALQIQALASSGRTLATLRPADPDMASRIAAIVDPALLVASALAVFAIVFGARHIDATAKRSGMVLAVAAESVFKIAAFLTVGAFVVFGLSGGPAKLFNDAIDAGFVDRLSRAATDLSQLDWFMLTALSAGAMFVLPRQFQMAVLENRDERHLRTACWLFPAYLLIINILVLPIALAGLVSGSEAGDMMLLDLAARAGGPWLALLAFLGGLSAAMAMIVVTSVALGTMVANDLIIPLLLRFGLLSSSDNRQIGGLILNLRRASIVGLLLAGYLFADRLGSGFSLSGIGLMAFAATVQALPALVAGLYWRDANLSGALTGLAAGFAIWAYTLILPAMADAGMVPVSIVSEGPFGIALLKPQALFGSEGMHFVAHAVLWSITANSVLLIIVSCLTNASNRERLQALSFVDGDQAAAEADIWHGDTRVSEVVALLRRFVGHGDLARFMDECARRHGAPLVMSDRAEAWMIAATQRRLTAAIGASSARVVLDSVLGGQSIGPREVMEILDEASQVVRYSAQLEAESKALTQRSDELAEANRRLQELDRMKDDFIATVSHELRTPLTSIRSFSEIILDNPELDETERAHFLEIVVTESERLTRLINDVLDLSKIESGKMEWHVEDVRWQGIIAQATAATKVLLTERRIALHLDLPDRPAIGATDRDRMVQVIVNLLSNAAKFVPAEGGQIAIRLRQSTEELRLTVADNGPGVPEKYRRAIFDKFHQVSEDLKDRPKGTGLGLTICREIIEHFGGRIWVEDSEQAGAAVTFTLPMTNAATD